MPAVSLLFHVPAHTVGYKQLSLLPFPGVVLKGNFKSIFVYTQMFAECSAVLLRRCYQNKVFLFFSAALVASECAIVIEQSGSSCTVSCGKVPGDQRSSCFSVWVLDDLSMFKVNSTSEHPSVSFYPTAFMAASVWTSLF